MLVIQQTTQDKTSDCNLEYLKLNPEIKVQHAHNLLINYIKEKFIKEVVNLDRLRNYFSSKITTKIYSDIEKLASDKNFTISMQSATNLIDSIISNSGNLITEQFMSAYKILTNNYNSNLNLHYKTLGGWKIDKKSRVRADWNNDINEIIKCCNLLDPSNSTDVNYNHYNIYRYDNEYKNATFDCGFFHCKFYKNGYAHVIFNNSDIVDKFNQKVGSLFNWLPY